MPDIKGLADFKGEVYHTGHWPHEGVDFTGLRVGVIGTGSSAIQVDPVIAEQAERLTVFQRTPNFTIPARNARADGGGARALSRREYPEIRRAARARSRATASTTELPERGALDDGDDERRAKYEARWAQRRADFMAVYNDLAHRQGRQRHRRRFRSRQDRRDRQRSRAARLLHADNHPIGTKRICIDTDYFDDLQPAERDAGRHQQQPDRGVHAARRCAPRRRITRSTRSCLPPASTP